MALSSHHGPPLVRLELAPLPSGHLIRRISQTYLPLVQALIALQQIDLRPQEFALVLDRAWGPAGDASDVAFLGVVWRVFWVVVDPPPSA